MSDYYLHRKTGGIYRILASEYRRLLPARIGARLMPLYGDSGVWATYFIVTDPIPVDTHVTYYENVLTGERWARPSEMFHDGRFAQFDRPPTSLLAALEAQAGAGA